MNSKRKLIDKLIDKFNEEYDNFIKEIKKLSTDEIIDKAYEITAKQEITNLYLENLDIRILKDLIKTDNLLDKIYKDFEDNNGSYYSLIEEYAYDYIDELSHELRKKEKEVER